MLRPEDNQFLTESGPGTGMGELLRRFWLPVLLSEELPEADGPPKKIVVMGEELLAFRDSRGVVGVIDQYCPHSGDPAAVVCNFLNSIRRAKGTLADPK